MDHSPARDQQRATKVRHVEPERFERCLRQVVARRREVLRRLAFSVQEM